MVSQTTRRVHTSAFLTFASHTYVIRVIRRPERPLDERTERKQPDRALHPRPAPASPASTTPRRALSTRVHHRSINDRARARRSSRRRRRHRFCASAITNHPCSNVCPRPRVFTSRASASTSARAERFARRLQRVVRRAAGASARTRRYAGKSILDESGLMSRDKGVDFVRPTDRMGN